MKTYTIYKKTHRKTGLKYLGYTSEDDVYQYPGSGIRWSRHLNKHGYDVDTEILFQTVNLSEIKPVGLHYSKLWNVVESKEWANVVPEEGYGGWSGYKSTGLVAAKDTEGNTLQVSKDDPRLQSGELVGVAKDTVTVVDINGVKSRVSKTDPRYLSGELRGVAAGTVMVKDHTGKTMRVSKDDPRYLSGELTSAAIGTISVVDADGNNLKVNKDDPRYLSGELKGVLAGRIKVMDNTGRKFMARKTDPRVISGELVKVSKDR